MKCLLCETDNMTDSPRCKRCKAYMIKSQKKHHDGSQTVSEVDADGIFLTSNLSLLAPFAFSSQIPTTLFDRRLEINSHYLDDLVLRVMVYGFKIILQMHHQGARVDIQDLSIPHRHCTLHFSSSRIKTNFALPAPDSIVKSPVEMFWGNAIDDRCILSADPSLNLRTHNLPALIVIIGSQTDVQLLVDENAARASIKKRTRGALTESVELQAENKDEPPIHIRSN